MENSKYIVTLDLGTEKIGVSVATIDRNKNISLSYYNEFPSEGIKHSKVTNPSKLGTKLKEILGMVEQAMNISITEVMVNVQRYGVRELDCTVESNTANGNVCLSDLDEMDNTAWDNRDVIADDEEIIACIPQSYDLDNGEINVSPEEVVGMASDNIKGKYKIYAIKQSFNNVIDNAFKDKGIITVRKVFAPDCVGACVLSESMRQGGVALIDLGAGASSVSIFHGGVLKHYGAIPFGGANISIDIANICGISERLAENIKLAYGGCIPDKLGSIGDKKLKITNHLDKSVREVSVKYLSEIITARQKEIIDALLYEIQTSGYADKLKNGVVLTGGAAAMLNICTFFKQISGYNAKVGTTSQNLFSSEDGSFFTLGASFSSGLLRSYAGTETSGCQSRDAQSPAPAAAAEPEVKEEETPAPQEELFAAEAVETAAKEQEKKPKQPKAPKGQGKSLLDLIKKSITGEREDNGKTEQDGRLFGEDEDV